MAHTPAKFEKYAGLAAALVSQELILPKLFKNVSLANYKGALDDTLTFKVPGNLPARDYAWRNNRSSGVTFDEYAETKVTITAGGNAVSAVRLTDEQADMDFSGWETLLDAQARGVAAWIQRGAAAYVAAAPYEVVLTGGASDIRSTFLKARSIQNRFGSTGKRIAVVGSDWEEAILADDDLIKATSVGDSTAASAVHEATFGKLAGYTLVTDLSIDPDAAYLFGDDAFLFVSMVPGVPQSVPFGATTSAEGIAMRWIRDYDSEYLRDRSIVNTYYGFQAVKDQFRYWDTSLTPDQEVNSTQHFVRAIKLTLSGEVEDSTYPVTDGVLDKATGVHEPA